MIQRESGKHERSTPKPQQSVSEQKSAAPPVPRQMDRRTATAGCRYFIQRALHDPGSAEFGHSDDAQVLIKGNRAMVIRSVRAKNAFGALRLQDFTCLLEDQAGTTVAAYVGQTGDNPALVASILEQWKLRD